MIVKKYACPCCGALSLDEKDDWDICSLCGWEDDTLQSKKPDLSGGANIMSLNEAKRNFKENVLYQKLVNQDHYCPLFDNKIAIGLCYEIVAVTEKELIYDAVPEIANFEKNEICLICNSCPINKAK